MSSTAAPSGRRERWAVWHPLLFAAYPVLFLWSQNVGEAGVADVVPVLVEVVGIALAGLVILSLVFRDTRRAALIVTPLAVAVMMYGHGLNLFGAEGLRTPLQQLAWIAVVAVGFVAAVRLGDPAVRQVTRVLDRVAVVLLVVVLVPIVPAQVSAFMTPAVTRSAPTTIARSNDRPLRDVYYVILDRYGSDRALKLRFGFPNDFTPWLAARGFRVLPDSHANYVKTTLSLAATLNMTYLADLAARVGKDNGDSGYAVAMLQDSTVVREFKALGYRYLHIGSFYAPTQIDSSADRNLYPRGPSDFAATFYKTTVVPGVLSRLHLSHGGLLERIYAADQYDWRALDAVRAEAGPKFVFAHVVLPHPPYVFGRQGQFVDEETAATLTEQEQFAGQLGWTNDQLKAWITELLAVPEDRRPIVILQADEGPYPIAYGRNTETFDWATASPTELEEKYGILNAWYVPDGTDPGLYDSITSINTFPVLFRYFGLDVPRLEDRSFISTSSRRPYDFVDITDRLAAGP